MIRTRNAFTLMELIITVVLLGIVAGFGLPNYQRSRWRTDEKEAVSNLQVIGGVMEIYRVRDDGDFYPAFNMPQATNINATLNLHIIERNMDYSCTQAGGGASYTCTATSASYNWEIRVRSAGANPGVAQCQVNDCPTRTQNAYY